MDRLQVTKDLIDLVNSDPMNNVEIAPIIEKYSEGLDFRGQSSVRANIQTIIRKFVDNGDMEIGDPGINHITTSQNQEFLNSGGKIRSTWKFEQERQNKLENKQSVQIGELKGNYVGGDMINSSQDFSTHLPAETPQPKQNKMMIAITAVGKFIITSGWKIAIGLIVIYIAYKLGFSK